MKILLFGSNGMLGSYVKLYLSDKLEIIPLIRKDYDIDNLSIKSLEKLFIEKKMKENDLVINCAGIIHHSSKKRKLDNKLYFKINSLFPVLLSQICNEFNIKMIHITTDCVFSGEKGNYDEKSPHDETNDYGVSKSLGELCNATIIRTSIIGEEINNKYSLLEWVKSNKNKEINGFINHYWNGVTTLQLSKIIYRIINEKLYWKGVRHIFSQNVVSKYELIVLINNSYNLNIKINKYKTIKNINKSLTTKYDTNKYFLIPKLNIQIEELSNYNIYYG